MYVKKAKVKDVLISRMSEMVATLNEHALIIDGHPIHILGPDSPFKALLSAARNIVTLSRVPGYGMLFGTGKLLLTCMNTCWGIQVTLSLGGI